LCLLGIGPWAVEIYAGNNGWNLKSILSSVIDGKQYLKDLYRQEAGWREKKGFNK
jgi:hypothetical protein